jgi:hypothetical protein
MRNPVHDVVAAQSSGQDNIESLSRPAFVVPSGFSLADYYRGLPTHKLWAAKPFGEPRARRAAPRSADIVGISLPDDMTPTIFG